MTSYGTRGERWDRDRQTGTWVGQRQTDRHMGGTETDIKAHKNYQIKFDTEAF